MHFYALASIFLLCSCSTVSIPVLRYETGETLGSNTKNISLHTETSRSIPTLPVIENTTFSANQEKNPLQSALLGLNVKYGILENIDLKLDTPFYSGGGGWRFSAKYQVFGAPAASSTSGNFAIAAMIGYGNFSSSGEVSYNPEASSTTSSSSSTTSTTASVQEYIQSLSASSIEFSFPISYKIFEGFIFYTGLHYSLLKAEGTIHYVSTNVSTSDLGFNLGIQNKFDSVLLNFEAMFLKVENPFKNETGFETYFGANVGITF